MTREEEIIKASADTFKEYGDEFTKAIKMFWMSAFIAGADCADKHPPNKWHDASEQPEDDIEPLIYSVDNGNFFGIENAHNLMIEIVGKKMRTWKKTVEYEGIDKWSYIRDILPEGGEL